MTLKIYPQGNLIRIENVETGDVDFPLPNECSFNHSGNTIYLKSSQRTYAVLYSDIQDENGQSKGSLDETLFYLTEFIG